MELQTNVKINLGLNVLRKRNDGFHDLETVFLPSDAFSDTLIIEEARKFSVEITGEGYRGWDPATDLTAKAYALLRKDFALPAVAIKLEKHSPVGAGLGGGSCDGAFALRALSEMFNLFLPDVVLEDYAASLGSDCPFFIRNTPVFATGRGECMDDIEIPALKNLRIEIVIPEGISVSTKEAYSGIVPALPEIPLREALKRSVEEWKDCIVNDFEKTVFSLHPELAEMKAELYRRGAVYAAMSGSGSALFGLFRR